MNNLYGVAIGAASRLLCVKRPDLFLPANAASFEGIALAFGVWPDRIDRYLQIIERIWSFPWFVAREPDDEKEKRVWRARVALLDAMFYEGQRK
ncbi:MAG: hypothetical protein WD534_07600 [Phycisphaeraceae bacterium]